MDHQAGGVAPRFSIKYSTFHHVPIMEILKDGQPFFEDLPGAKRHFRFGVIKAAMILECMPILKEFLTSDGKLPDEMKSMQTELAGPIVVQKYPGFKDSRGTWHAKPYLCISRDTPVSTVILDGRELPPAVQDRINFGLLKADALLKFKNDIAGFVERGYQS